MKLLKLFLTVPENATAGKIQINVDGYGFYSSKLPWFEAQKSWRTTMIKALGAVEFESDLFPNEEEIDWMVNQGWLTDTKTHFTSDILKKIGQDIYHTLFPTEEARSLLSGRLGNLKHNQQLHIQLQFSEKIEQRGRLPDYPWELACDERGFLAGRQVTFSRLIAFNENIPDLPPVEQINVLLVSSTVGDSEIDLPNLGSQEQKAILRGLKQAEDEDNIVVECKKNISFKDLGDYLTQIPSAKTPHIIHFDGHGFFGKRCHKPGCRNIHKQLRATHCRKCNSPLEENPQGYLLFEPNIDDWEREVDYISASEIGDLIRKINLDLENKPELGVRLVALSACRSGTTLGSDSVFNGIAQQLIAQQIPAVVAMQYNITVDGATAFAERFYRALGNKKPLTTAVSIGQTAMSREGNQWYRPVLYLRWDDNDGGQLFAPENEKTTTHVIPSNLPLSGATEFIGREVELQQVADYLHSNQQVAISAIAGMGGVGKTELALQYAHHQYQQKTYPGGVCWLRVRGENLAVQIQSYAQGELGLTLPDNEDVEVLLDSCWRQWQARDRDILLIYDDVKEYQDIKPYLPPSDYHHFQVLITTRERLGKPVQRLDLDILKPRQALKLLVSFLLIALT